MKGIDYFWGKFLRRGDDLQKVIETAKAAQEAAKHAEFEKVKAELLMVQQQLPTLATKEQVGAVEKVLPTLATKERVDGGLGAQREQIHEIDRWLTKVDTRQRDQLGIALSEEVRTSPGFKPNPELAAAIAKFKGETPP